MPYNTLAIHRLVALTEQQSHLAPDIPFTVDCAHAVMQFHVGCRAAFCLRRPLRSMFWSQLDSWCRLRLIRGDGTYL